MSNQQTPKENDPFNYIKRYYGISAKVGDKVSYSGGKFPQEGTIVGADGAYLRVQLDRDPYIGKYHPTWELKVFPTLQ